MQNKWKREEHILAFNLYCKIPFTKINQNHPLVKELAILIGRTKGSVAMKLANFARLDPDLQKRNISGLKQGAKGEEEVWNEFNDNWEELAWESEVILAKYKNNNIEDSLKSDNDFIIKEGAEKESVVKVRVNQSFFRETVLSSYDNKCCITGISIPELLTASHIIPWSKNKENRINPSNGLCLNELHHRAFDKGLLTITPDYYIKISERLAKGFEKYEDDSFFIPYNNEKIILPQRFFPNKEFLDYHYSQVFLK